MYIHHFLCVDTGLQVLGSGLFATSIGKKKAKLAFVAAHSQLMKREAVSHEKVTKSLAVSCIKDLFAWVSSEYSSDFVASLFSYCCNIYRR